MINLRQVTTQEAEKVLFDPEIYDRISDDLCPLTVDLPDIDYWGGYIGDELASITIYHPFRDGLKIHFHVLKPYRSMARHLLDISLLYEGPIYVEIPTKYQSVINFAKNAGFTEIERRFNSYCKNGKLYDKVLLWDS